VHCVHILTKIELWLLHLGHQCSYRDYTLAECAVCSASYRRLTSTAVHSAHHRSLCTDTI